MFSTLYIWAMFNSLVKKLRFVFDSLFKLCRDVLIKAKYPRVTLIMRSKSQDEKKWAARFVHLLEVLEYLLIQKKRFKGP